MRTLAGPASWLSQIGGIVGVERHERRRSSAWRTARAATGQLDRAGSRRARPVPASRLRRALPEGATRSVSPPRACRRLPPPRCRASTSARVRQGRQPRHSVWQLLRDHAASTQLSSGASIASGCGMSRAENDMSCWAEGADASSIETARAVGPHQPGRPRHNKLGFFPPCSTKDTPSSAYPGDAAVAPNPPTASRRQARDSSRRPDSCRASYPHRSWRHPGLREAGTRHEVGEARWNPVQRLLAVVPRFALGGANLPFRSPRCNPVPYQEMGMRGTTVLHLGVQGRDVQALTSPNAFSRRQLALT